MNTLREAAEKALEALESLQGGCTDSNDGTVEAITVWCPEIIDDLRAALAEPEPEPVHRLMRKEGAAWIPASEWLTGEPDKSWLDLVADSPAEWRIAEPIDGKTFSDALGKALRPEPEPVAWVIATEYEDGSRAGNHLEWLGSNEANDFPVGTKLYIRPQP